MSHVANTASVPCSFFQRQNIVYIFTGGFTVSPRPKTARSIAGQIEKTFQANMRLLQESMAGLPKNCKAYLDRVLAVARLQQNYRDERAARGLDPVNLGNSARTVYSFSATLSEQDGQVDAKRQAWEQA